MKTYFELDWSRWVFGVDVDRVTHWSEDRRFTEVNFFFGPIHLGFDF